MISGMSWDLLLPAAARSEVLGVFCRRKSCEADRLTEDTFLFRQFVLGLDSSQQPLVSIAGTATSAAIRGCRDFCQNDSADCH